jgi:hypothetical protein
MIIIFGKSIRKGGKILLQLLLTISERSWVRKIKLSGMGLQAKVCPGKVF